MPAKNKPAKNQNQPQRAKKAPRRRNRKPKPTGITQSKLVAAPAAYGTADTIRKPRIQMKKGSYCVSHSELIGSVNGSVDFAHTEYAINPGQASVFPWLCNIAANYESYKFKKLHFRYMNSVGSNTLGTVYLVPEFDASDPAPNSENQVATWDDVATGSTWVPHVYKCASYNLNKRSSYYVRTGSVPANADITLYDVGYLVMSTIDCSDASRIGKLWVDYEVEFRTPQSGPAGVGLSMSSKFAVSGDFAGAPVKTGNAPLTASVATNVLTVTATDTYECLFTINVNGTTFTNGPAVAGTAAPVQLSSTFNAAGTLATFTGIATFLPGETLTFTKGSGTVTSSTLRIAQYNNAVNG